jgi:PAS domain S-box-containing protein
MGNRVNSEEADRWKFAVEAGTDGLWDWNLKTGRLFYSPRWKEILGYSDDEIGDSIEEWQKRVHPDDLKRATDTASRCLINGESESYSLEHRMICKDGSVKWILSSGKVVSRDSKGKPVRAIGIHKDISEIQRANEELRESYQFLKIAGSTANFGVWRYSTKDGIFSGSEILSDIFDLPHYTRLNIEEISAFYAPSDRKKISDSIFDCIESGIAFDNVVRLQTSKGINKWVRATGQPVTDDLGAITGILGSLQDITSEKESQEELHRTHSSLILSLSASNSGSWDWDIENDIFYWSPEMYTLFGIETSVKPGIDAWTSRLHPDDHAQAWHDLQESMDSQKQLASEFRIVLPGKRIRWIRSVGNTIFRDSMPVRMTGICIDVTERRTREDELRQHRDNLEELVNERSIELRATLNEVNDLYENAPCGYHSLDSSGKIIRMNNTELEWLGYKREELVGIMKFTDIITPASIKVFQANFPNFLKKGQIDNTEFELVRKDGTLINVAVNATAVFDIYGDLRYSRSTVFDITNRKKLEDKLVIASQRLELATRAGGVGIWDWDVINDTLVWDDQMFRLYGTDRNKFKGAYEAWFNGLHPEDKDYAVSETNKALNGEKDYDIEFRVCRDDGSISNLKAIATVIRDNAGKPVRMIGTNWDITTQKRAEADLKAAKVKIEESNRIKSEFLTNISHEIRTPLNAVIGYAELLEMRLKDPEMKKYLESIKSGGIALMTLINDILDIAVIENGMLHPEEQITGTRKLFNEFGKLFEFSIREKDLTYECIVAENVPENIYIDSQKLRQIVLNLVGNAVKFTEHGEVKLSVKCEKAGVVKSDDGPHGTADIIIKVSDTGIGIAPEYQKEIFKSFVQVGNKTIQSGTGLGLAIAKRLTEMMEGKIEVKSEPGKGSTFTVILPAVRFRIDNNNPALKRSSKFSETIERNRSLNSNNKPPENQPDDPSGLKLILDGEMAEKCRSFSKRQPLGEIRSFGNKLVSLGKKHKSRTITEYGKDLESAAARFDVEAILRLLEEYDTRTRL